MRLVLLVGIFIGGTLNTMFPDIADCDVSAEVRKKMLHKLRYEYGIDIDGLENESSQDIIHFEKYLREDPYLKEHCKWVAQSTYKNMTPLHAALLYIRKKESTSTKYITCDRIAMGCCLIIGSLGAFLCRCSN